MGRIILPEQSKGRIILPTDSPAQALGNETTGRQVEIPEPTAPTQPDEFFGTPMEEFNSFEQFIIGAGRTAGAALDVFNLPGIAIREVIARTQNELTGGDLPTLPEEETATARDILGTDEPGREPSFLGDVVAPTALEFATDDAIFFGPIRAAKRVGEGVKAAFKGPAAEPEAVVKAAKRSILSETQGKEFIAGAEARLPEGRPSKRGEVVGEGFTARPAPPAIAASKQLQLEDLSAPVPRLETTAQAPLLLEAPQKPLGRVPLTDIKKGRTGDKFRRDAKFIGTEQGDIVIASRVYAKTLDKTDKAVVRQAVKDGDVLPTDKVVPAEGMAPVKVVNSTPEQFVKQKVRDSNKGLNTTHYDEPILDVKPLDVEKQLGVGRIVRDPISVLSGTGPVGNRASRVLRSMEMGWERATSKGLARFEDVLTKEFGKRSLALGPFSKRLNPLRTKGITKQWKVTEAENEALVNYLYSGGDAKWLGALNSVAQQKVTNVADTFFSITKQVNQQAGIQKLKRWRPDGTSVPFGKPSMFFPQRPEKPKLIARISENSLERFLKRARVEQDNPHLSIAEFRKQMTSQHDKFGEVGEGSKFIRGLEDTRSFDASNGNTESAYKNLIEKGYGPDTLRNLAGYTISANKKAALVENSAMLAKLETDLVGVLPKNNAFVTDVFKEFKGTTVELADEFATNFWARVRSFNAGTLLQMATINNLNQFTFIIQKGGLLATMKASLRLKGFTIPVVGKFGEAQKITDIARKSGALYNIYMQELSAPRHAWSRYAQFVLHANGFTRAETWMRSTAANIGGMQAVMLAKSALKNVNNPRKLAIIRKQLDELSIPLDEVLRIGGLTEEMALGASQRMANEVTGRRTLQGVPAFVLHHDQLRRTILQFKEFMFTNVAEMSRVILNSPTHAIMVKRLLRGGSASLVVGEITRDIAFFLTGGGTIFPTTEERVPKRLRDIFGEGLAARAVDSVIAGYANIAMVLAATWLQGQSFAELFGGPTVGFIDDIFKKGPVKAVSRRAFGPRQTPEEVADPFAGDSGFGGEGFGGI